MDIISRLKEYISYLQTPVTQFADTARIPRPTLSQLLNGRNKKVSDEVIAKIHSAYPQLNMLWLLFGEGEMLSEDSILAASKETESKGLPKDIPLSVNSLSPGIDFSEEFVKSSSDKFEISSEASPVITSDGKEETVITSTASGGATSPSQAIPPSFSEIKTNDHKTLTSGIKASGQISFSPSSDRKIVNIIIYYSDNSFESFVPES